MNELALCAGVGGLSLGLKIAIPDHRIVCYVERESYAASTLVARMEDKTLDKAPIWDDVTTFNGKAWRGKVDIVTAGYPCQPFSTAGKKLGTKDPRHIWPDIARVIGEVKPAWVFIENVPNHLQLGFDEVRSDLQGLGFGIEAGLFSAEETGAPHIRKRLFALAYAIGSQPTGRRNPRDILSSTSGAQEKAQQRERGRDTIGNGGRAGEKGYVAYAEGGGFGRRQDKQGRKREIRVRPNAQRKSATRRARIVADAEIKRLQEWRHKPGSSYSSSREAQSDGSDTGLDGPGSSNGITSWHWPTEPDVGRMVDGFPGRADRLRVAGQGVVPVVAALAFATLWEVLACNSQ